MAKVYESLDKATKHISASVILKNGEVKGRIIVKYPKDGAGRLYVFIHEYGLECLQGMASGYGYDKTGAAISDAYQQWAKEYGDSGICAELYRVLEPVTYNGEWQNVLRKAGYEVVTIC